MYIMVVSAPQHKSAAAVSTIGGEGGGRVAIVVEDQNAQGKPHEDERPETTAIPCRAEPGRDIFSGEPIQEIKSLEAV